MLKERIQVVRDGEVEAVDPTDPILTSSSSPLQGILLEQHTLPAGELPPAAFINHLVTVNIAGPYFQQWRTEGKSGRLLMAPGAVCLCSGQEVWAAWDRSIQFVALTIDPQFMQKAAYEAVTKRVILRPEPSLSDQVIVNLVHAIHAEIRFGCPGGPLLGESLATDLSAYLLRQHAIEPIRLPYFKGGIPRTRLQRVLDYIEAALAAKLRVEELARIAEMSPWYFGKLFKESTGMTVHQYVTKRRLRQAMHLLQRESIEINEIGAAIGIPDQSQFTRLFHKSTGITPRRYRAESAG